MTDRTLKQEKDNVFSAPAAELPQAWEEPDLYLPVATEASSVPAESRVVVYNDPRSPGADRFRWAGMRLKSIQDARGLKTLLITSPLPGDGKSTVALNLATVLTEKGKCPVLLVEADTYRPSLVKKLGLRPWPGMYECYKRKSEPRLAIRRIDPLGFYLLPAGQAEGDDNILFQSNFVPQLIRDLASSSFSWILIDSPPTTPIAEILALKAHADATLLVARAGHTPRHAIEETTRNLGRDHIIGIILNGVEGLDRIYSKYYGYVKPQAPVKAQTSKGAQGLGLNKLGK
jgi:Mrp family chromosome partitioning ATPase